MRSSLTSGSSRSTSTRRHSRRSSEIRDPDGQVVCLVSGPCLIRKKGNRAWRTSERALLTVLFTDLVGSTEHAAQLGDTAWAGLLDQHNDVVARQVEIHKGRSVKNTGDGVLAVFASPSRAVMCARGIRDGLSRLGLQARAGIHTGECEVSGADIAGIAVHVAARIEATATAGEILLSSAVRELIAGSDIQLVERGRHRLRGIEDDYLLYAVADHAG
jgi:class 3 adenylate cyclase